jgi:hypothetical protein
MNSLIAGLVLIALAAILFLILLRAARSGRSTGLFSDSWVANIHAPLMCGLLTFGSGYLIKFALVAIL